jgi:hypothetical protein
MDELDGCPNGSVLCDYREPCTPCVEDEDAAEESVARHVKTCTADGFCYICQCL